MIIDCDTCQVRGLACGDCVVAVLIGPPSLDAEERRALGVLAEAGLVPPLRLAHPDEAPEHPFEHPLDHPVEPPRGRPVTNDTRPPGRRAV
jgi:hypothetical protein